MKYIFPFEKLEIWKLSITLSKKVYLITSDFPKEEKYGVTSQLRRAANSVGANIAEGVVRKTNKEKARFIEISYGSLMEVLHFLVISKEVNFIENNLFESIKDLIAELANKINAYNNFLKSKI